jgi:hypothetical protein
MFLLWAQKFGIKTAIDEAAKSRWQYQRPLQALLAAMSERGKNYTKRSVGRKPQRAENAIPLKTKLRH